MSKNAIQVCHRVDGEILVTEVPYEGLLDAKTMEGVNALFLEKAASGYFYPLDPMDAYHDVWMQLEAKAGNLPELVKASPHTYLCGSARLMFLCWFKRKVEPARRMYRKIEDLHFDAKGAVGIDDFDIDNYDGTQDVPSKRMTDATDRGDGERLSEPEDISAQHRGELLTDDSVHASGSVRRTLERIFAHLPCDAVRAFSAYIAANGNLYAAAHLMGMPKTTYYRKWPTWIAMARSAAERIER